MEAACHLARLGGIFGARDASLSRVRGSCVCRTGKFVRELCFLPLALDIPIAFSSCRKGPRSLEWRDDKPASLCWIEAQVAAEPAQLFLEAATAGLGSCCRSVGGGACWTEAAGTFPRLSQISCWFFLQAAPVGSLRTDSVI